MPGLRTSLRGPTNNSDEIPAFRPIIRLGERMTALGQTGSGKTHLMMRLLDRAIPAALPIVVIDPKNAVQAPSDNWQIVESLPRAWEREIRRPKRPHFRRLIVRPFLREFPESKVNSEALNEIWRRLWEQKREWLGNDWRSPTLAYIDEIKLVTDGNRAHWSLSRLVEQGRQPGLMIWGGTQRPSLIPRMFLSDADHKVCFRLLDEADRERASEVFGEAAREMPGPGQHDFWYREPGVAQLEPVLVHQEDEEE